MLQGGYQRLFDAPRAYESVTADDIRKLAAELLRPGNRTVGVLTAKQRADRPGRRPMKTVVACSRCSSFPSARVAASNGVKVPPFERVQLGNGAVVLLMERHDVPLIAFSAALRGGAITDPDGSSGLASLLAGLLQKGAGARDAVQFAETVASVGGQIETAASTESIGVSGSFLARDQQLMVELLADMLQRPRLELTQFDTLRARQIEFIRAAKESDLAALTPIYGEASLFAGHPYGRPVDGSEASLAALKHADLQRYYQEQVGADRLILAVVGDFKARS